jgi:DNA-binding NarL/FixJ family response regulator
MDTTLSARFFCQRCKRETHFLIPARSNASRARTSFRCGECVNNKGIVVVVIADDYGPSWQDIRAALLRAIDWGADGQVTGPKETVSQAGRSNVDIADSEATVTRADKSNTIQDVQRPLADGTSLVVVSQNTNDGVLQVLQLAPPEHLLDPERARRERARIESPKGHGSSSNGSHSPVPGLRDGRGASDPSDEILAEALGLTPRELEILQFVADARTIKETASALGITVRTVEAHRASIMRKLDLHSAASLIRYAIQHKLVNV